MRLVANDRKFDVDYNSFFVFKNRQIFMRDIPCFDCRFKYCQDSTPIFYTSSPIISVLKGLGAALERIPTVKLEKAVFKIFWNYGILIRLCV